MTRQIGFLLLAGIAGLLSACSIIPGPLLSEGGIQAVASPVGAAVDTAGDLATAAPATPAAQPPSATPSGSITSTATNTAEPTATATSTPDILGELAGAVPPRRDDVRLAQAFKGYDAATLPTPQSGQIETLQVGTRDSFNVLDVVNNTYSTIDAELLALGEHAYFWFELGPDADLPDLETLAAVAAEFDLAYAQLTELFGREETPGIDGDSRLHVLHASPQTICGLAEGDESGCATAGFVSSSDSVPAEINPQSNERDMFVMNSRQFGSEFYLGVLAHEFRHLIEANYDPAAADWEKEGSAVLATELLGLSGSGVQRANAFLAQPDQQLNSWAENGTGPYYGQGYLFNQYLFDRLGEETYREFAISPLPGLAALDAIAEANGLATSGDELWQDWLVALAIHDRPGIDNRYAISADGLNVVEPQPLRRLPAAVSSEVHQYAADYYLLPDVPVTVTFSGDDTVPLLLGHDAEANIVWLAQRANFSNPRLTRPFDLTALDEATLTYDVYADIETGYDFAYVSVSSDGGVTWEPLAAEGMQGLDTQDDPSGSALAPRFYSARDQAWRSESIDLTPYVGREILLRFEMVTDPVLTYSGLAIDNVSVPELNYVDEGGGPGWVAEGFSAVPTQIPQRWSLQLISPGEAGLEVQHLDVSAQGKTAFRVTPERGQRPILIIAASSPMTLESASYSLHLNEMEGSGDA